MIKQQSTVPRSKCVNEDCHAVLEPDHKFCSYCGANQRARRIVAATSDRPPLPGHSTQGTENGKSRAEDSSDSVQLPAHLICQLCSKPYKEPRILPCLHSFCEECLCTEIERSGTKQSIECPTCQSVIIPEGGVNAIHQNLHLGFEVEVARYMSKINSCSNHKEKKLKFYCNSCQNLICRDCTIALHKSHKITEICSFANNHREGMREALVCAQEVTSKLTSAVNANDKMAEEVRTSREKATLLINQAFEQLHQTIEERKKTLLSEIAAISVSKTTALTLQKEQLMHVQDEISRYTEMTSHILQTYTDHEVAAFRDLLPNELKAIMKKVENMSLTPNQSSDIHVYLDSGPLIKELSIFGDVMDSVPSPSQSTWSSKSVARVNNVYCIEVETKTSRGKRCDHGGLQVKGELRSKSHDGAVVIGETEDHGDGTYTITLTPQRVGSHQLVITVEGEHVQRSPCDFDVKTSYLTLCNPQQVINCSGGSLGIAIDDSGDIYVTCFGDNIIHVFDEAGHQKRTIGSSGSDDGQFNRPCGIFIKGDVIFVADLGNHRIQKLTTQGKFIQKFGQQGSGQGQFTYPVSVIVDLKDRMIVSDQNNHRVIIMDEAGTWLLTINGNVSGSHAFQSPRDLALDPQGNIHVASSGSNTIKVFTSEGTYVRSYGDVKCPTGIAIDEEGCSFVCGITDNSLSIFDSQGSKMHTVGNLSGPFGVLLDHKNGYLYVANYYGNNVLKYFV